MLDCTIFCSQQPIPCSDIRLGGLRLHGDLGVEGLHLDLCLHGVDGDDGMEQAEAESGNMSVFSFLHGEYS